MKILITGGAGFIGSNLVTHLNEVMPTAAIAVLDDLSTGHKGNLTQTKSELVEASILDVDALSYATSGVQCIVHFAALGSVPRSIKDPLSTNEVNVTGTLRVLEAARINRVPHVIVASSSSVYGSNPKIPKSETDWTRPLSPYGVSKLATEGYALAYSSSFAMKTLALRFFNVYGPRQRADHPYAAVIPRFLQAALARKSLTIYGDGKQSRDFTHVSSVCKLIEQAINREVALPTPMNVGFGRSTAINQVVREIESSLGIELDVTYEPARAGDVKISLANSNLMLDQFPDLLPVELAAGIASTISWHREATPN